MIVGDQSGVVAFLSGRDAYPGVRGDVRRVETHASVVFLAGERAYKMKRAVRFDYMDYGTLERRRAFCEAEVTLNRRTAHDLYLGAVAVTRDAGGGLLLSGAGEPVEWLVEMRRFDEAGLFDRLAVEGRLTRQHLDDAAAAVAAFHREAERLPAHPGYIPFSAVAEENTNELRAGGSVFPADRVDRYERRSRQWAAQCQPLLDARRRDGFVRRCHGDLHLRNLVLHGGRPVLFDCIEFNDSFAVIDVLYDFAFLLMDLLHRGLSAEANAAFNRYLWSTGDLGGLAALPLLLSCRAAIRAHVSAPAAAGREEEDAEAAERTRAEGRSYLALANALLEPLAPCLVAIGGLSGTGKSAQARELAPWLGAAPGAVILRSDVVRKRLYGVPDTERLGPEGYARGVTGRVYRILGEEAEAALAGGQAVVVDAVSVRPEEREALAVVARRTGVPFIGLWLEAPLSVREERVDGRRWDASDATPEIVRRQAAMDTGTVTWTRVDATGGTAAVAVVLSGQVPADCLGTAP